MRVALGLMVQVRGVILDQIHILSHIASLHPLHIIPIDPTTKSSSSFAVQFVILSIIATT